MQQLIKRFISYITIDSQSNPNSDTTPSTQKQWNVAYKLVEDLKLIGLSEITIDEKGYIMATLPSNIEQEVPTIGFIAHYDTSPDFTAEKVQPQIIENYNGKDIVLNADENIILSPDYFKELKNYIGQTLITTNGQTLLGADDKAGITEIITAMEYLIQHPEIPHGKIRIGFTPDEEIGRGAHHFNVTQFDADWAYTIDGSEIGELEYENFNAASVKITLLGKNIHPGYAKDKMINSVLVAQKILSKLPPKEIPEKTRGYEGFFHVHHVSGTIEKSIIELIIRDHSKYKFNKRKKQITQIVAQINTKYQKTFGGNIASLEINNQYYNMKEKIEPVFHIVELAQKAMEQVGIKPIIKPIRGGTDGSQLSYMGLPCPNIFAGGHNFHGKYEYIPVESMQKAVAVIVQIATLNTEK
jgi:tripeptide aminopeptidase